MNEWIDISPPNVVFIEAAKICDGWLDCSLTDPVVTWTALSAFGSIAVAVLSILLPARERRLALDEHRRHADELLPLIAGEFMSVANAAESALKGLHDLRRLRLYQPSADRPITEEELRFLHALGGIDMPVARQNVDIIRRAPQKEARDIIRRKTQVMNMRSGIASYMTGRSPETFTVNDTHSLDFVLKQLLAVGRDGFRAIASAYSLSEPTFWGPEHSIRALD